MEEEAEVEVDVDVDVEVSCTLSEVTDSFPELWKHG